MSIDPAIDANAKPGAFATRRAPHTIHMADGDNVAIVANDSRVHAGTVLDSTLDLFE